MFDVAPLRLLHRRIVMCHGIASEGKPTNDTYIMIRQGTEEGHSVEICSACGNDVHQLKK
jgi:hypothetical protein